MTTIIQDNAQGHRASDLRQQLAALMQEAEELRQVSEIAQDRYQRAELQAKAMKLETVICNLQMKIGASATSRSAATCCS